MIMRYTIALFFLFATVACAPSVKVTSDYDKTANFSSYKTYAFTTESSQIPVEQLNRDRIIRAVENEMAAKGFTKSDSPDMLVDITVKSKTRTEATATNNGGYHGRYGYGGGYTTTRVDYNEYTDGSLFITFIDKSAEKIIWQGRGTRTIDENASASKRESNINNAVKMIFSKYPPLVK
jgi:hypothetical protein